MLTILLFCTLPSIAEDSGFYLEEWKIGKGGPDVINVQDFPAGFLPEGLDYLDLLVVGEPADGPELALIGYGDDTLYFGSTTFGMFMNPVKTYSRFDEEMSCRFLIAAHAASIVAFKEGNTQHAVQYYEEACSAFERVSCNMNWCYTFESAEHFQESPFSEFISMNELASILSDYAIIFKNDDQIRARAFAWCAAVIGEN